MALIDLILQHPDVTRQPSGRREALAWCPWHPDKKPGGTPNLSINPQKQIAKCFSCGEHGIKKLAAAWGIEDPDQDGRLRTAPPPYLSATAAMHRLEEAYALRQETVDHFLIEPKPDSPSPNRRTRGAWAYPTPAGTRFKAFDRGSKPKYWWTRGTKAEARRSSLYGLADIPPGTSTVYLVNGEPSVWVCWQAGIHAVCAFGEGNLPPEAIKRLADLGAQSLRIVLDLDQAGEANTARDAEIIRDVGLQVSAGELPDYLGEKADVADLYLWHKGDDDAFRKALATLPDKELPGPDPLKGTRYFERGGRYYVKQQTRDGELEIPLTNFVAWAEEETEFDDGTDQELFMTMAGRLDSGTNLKAVQIPSSKVNNLDWITANWGYAPIIRSGPGSKDNVREVLQRVSLGRGLNRRVIFSHTGWRQIEGEWRFLTPGGAVGHEGVDVKLLTPYSKYWLPVTPENVVDAIRASLRMMDVADRRITIPLFAFTYLAPLQSILMPAFTLWLRASSGSFKSTITALAMSHFGDFQYNTPPSTWEATPRGLERYLYDLKDNMAWVDDFNPRQSDREMQAQHAKADAVLRSLGNVQGRLRMRADLSIQKIYLPRAMMVSTGEIYPNGESVIARTMAIDYMRGQVDVPMLSKIQEQASLFPHAMAAYVLWIGKQYDHLAKTLPTSFAEIRNRATTGEAREHARTPAAVAHLQLAIDLFAGFATEMGAATQEEMERLSDEAWVTLTQLGEHQTSRLREESPVERYLHVLDTLLAQGKVAIHERGSEKQPNVGQDLLGWYDTDYVYLDPVATYNRVSRWYRDEGRTLGSSEDTIRRSLLEQGILQRQGGDEHHLASRISVNGRRHRVVTLNIDKLPFGEQFKKELI